MEFILHPWHLLVLALSAWINREQEKLIEYLRVENEVLREKLGKGRILLNDDQRRRLAVKGKFLGRKALPELATIVTPDTILRWHPQLVALKWDYSDRRKSVDRPRIREVIVHFIVRMARDNESWAKGGINRGLTLSKLVKRETILKVEAPVPRTTLKPEPCPANAAEGWRPSPDP